MTSYLRNLLFAVGAAALLIGIVIGVIWLRNGPASAGSHANQPGPAVLVAARPIDPGTLLRGEDMTWRDIGDAKPPASSFVRANTSEAEMIGAVARRSFTSGELITPEGVLRPSERGFLAATLRPGYRAVTIPVEAAQSASGLILPGDHVDVILVQQLETKAPGRNAVGETVLRDARVVAVGRAFNVAPPDQASNKSENSSAAQNPPRTLTLEALPTDAERLVVAHQLGKLEVALRSVAEPVQTAEIRPIFAGDVTSIAQSGADADRPVSLAARQTPHKSATHKSSGPEALPPVEILRGSKTSQP